MFFNVFWALCQNSRFFVLFAFSVLKHFWFLCLYCIKSSHVLFFVCNFFPTPPTLHGVFFVPLKTPSLSSGTFFIFFCPRPPTGLRQHPLHSISYIINYSFFYLSSRTSETLKSLKSAKNAFCAPYMPGNGQK